MGKQDEAQRALEGIFRFNGRTIPDMTKTMPILAQKASRNRSSSSIKDLRPYRNLRINIFIMFILWCVYVFDCLQDKSFSLYLGRSVSRSLSLVLV